MASGVTFVIPPRLFEQRKTWMWMQNGVRKIVDKNN